MKRKGSLTWIPGVNDPNPHSGHYRARLYLADGTRPVVHLPPGLSPTKAQEMAAALTEKARAGNASFIKGRPAGKTIGDLIDAWLPLVDKDPRLSPATRHDHTSNAKKVRAAFGAMRPEELTPGVLRRWIRSLEVLSASRIGRTWATLGKMIDTAMGEEWISLPANPCRHPGMKGVLPPVEAPEKIVTLSAEQIATLLESPRRLRYLVALTSGLRDGEISGLTWADIRQEQGIWVYDVNKNLAYRGPAGRGSMGKTKTRSSKRLVPVHSAVLAMWPANLAFVSSSRPAEPLFPDVHGKPYRPASARLLRDALNDQSPGMTFHALRRTFSTLLDRAGVAGDVADRLLGHAAASVRLRRYTSGDLRQMKEAVEAAWQPPKPDLPWKTVATKAEVDDAFQRLNAGLLAECESEVLPQNCHKPQDGELALTPEAFETLPFYQEDRSNPVTMSSIAGPRTQGPDLDNAAGKEVLKDLGLWVPEDPNPAIPGDVAIPVAEQIAILEAELARLRRGR